MSKRLDTEEDDIKDKVMQKLKRRKSISVVKYDPETDTHFHDIDMEEFRKWKQHHDDEYREDLEILRNLEKMCPKEGVVYSGYSSKNKEQMNGNLVYEILYGFHELANENYLAIYGEESSSKRKRYENMKKRAKKYLMESTSSRNRENNIY